MKKSATIELSQLAGQELVESMARELTGVHQDDSQWPSRFAIPGPKAAPRWGSRFATASAKDAGLRR